MNPGVMALLGLARWVLARDLSPVEREEIQYEWTKARDRLRAARDQGQRRDIRRARAALAAVVLRAVLDWADEDDDARDATVARGTVDQVDAPDGGPAAVLVVLSEGETAPPEGAPVALLVEA